MIAAACSVRPRSGAASADQRKQCRNQPPGAGIDTGEIIDQPPGYEADLGAVRSHDSWIIHLVEKFPLVAGCSSASLPSSYSRCQRSRESQNQSPAAVVAILM